MRHERRILVILHFNSPFFKREDTTGPVSCLSHLASSFALSEPTCGMVVLSYQARKSQEGASISIILVAPTPRALVTRNKRRVTPERAREWPCLARRGRNGRKEPPSVAGCGPKRAPAAKLGNILDIPGAPHGIRPFRRATHPTCFTETARRLELPLTINNNLCRSSEGIQQCWSPC